MTHCAHGCGLAGPAGSMKDPGLLAPKRPAPAVLASHTQAGMAAVPRSHAHRLSWLALVSMLAVPLLDAVPARAEQAAAPALVASQAQHPTSAPTTFVLSSKEEIPAPFPTKQTLPATLSIDAFTPEEIQRIRQDVYDSIQTQDETPREGVAGCMQWVFFRTEPKAPWLAFGMVGAGRANNGMAKLNGRYFSVYFDYTIDKQERRGLMGTLFGDTAGKGPGHGRTWVKTFVPKKSYAQWLMDEQHDQRLASEFFREEAVAGLARLEFGRTSQLIIEAADTPCTHLKARCRRYVLPVTEEARWWLSGPKKDGRSISIPVGLAPGIQYEVAIEDMCPFGRNALVERSINTRMGGAEPGVRDHGLKNNASLKAALRPYVSK